MRYPASEKLEIIRFVGGFNVTLPVRFIDTDVELEVIVIQAKTDMLEGPIVQVDCKIDQAAIVIANIGAKQVEPGP